MQDYFPGLLGKCFILNTPLFFPDIWEANLRHHVDPATSVIMTGSSTHPELQAAVDADRLSALYGGLCSSKGGCLTKDRGSIEESKDEEEQESENERLHFVD